LVRAPLSACAAQVLAASLLFAQQPESGGAAAVAETILWGAPIVASDRTRDLPRDAQERLIQFRQRERMFHTSLKPPPGATSVEQELFEQRVAIERVLFCLFPRGDIFRVAAAYASDAEIQPEWDGQSDPPRHEAAFIDSLLRDLPQPWLGPYLHLIAGHRKLCASQLEGTDPDAAREALAADAKRQIAHARDGGQPIVRVVAEYLLKTERCREP
jgi:hypothetical protein